MNYCINMKGTKRDNRGTIRFVPQVARASLGGQNGTHPFRGVPLSPYDAARERSKKTTDDGFDIPLYTNPVMAHNVGVAHVRAVSPFRNFAPSKGRFFCPANRLDWAKMLQVKYQPTEGLIPYFNNSRTHSDEQVTQIASSLKEFGFTNPILVDEDNSIIAGHGRLLAAKKIGLAEVPTIALNGLTKAQKRAYVIADNKLALNAGWDEEMLRLEFAALQEDGFDLDLTGFNADEIEAITPVELNAGLTDKDEAPEPPIDPITKPGDVWILGKHRVMCGDSTSVDAVDTLMAGSNADFVYMDPPYGMNLNTDYARSNLVKGKTYSPVIGDDRDFDPKFFFEYFKEAREHFWWGADYYCQELPKGGSWVVWDKKKDGLDESIGTGYELCWSMSAHKRIIARFLWSGFTAKERNESRVHPTQKPIALHEWFFDRWGKPTDTVVDLFGGSGSTLIACEKTNRQARLMELDPKYCDVIVKRWQDFTGKKATLEATGQEFDSLEPVKVAA